MAQFSVSVFPSDDDDAPAARAAATSARPDPATGSNPNPEPLPYEPLTARLTRIVGNTSGMWAVGDQLIVSAGNFATNVILARSLSHAQYGSFGILLETILFLNSLQAALVIYPLTVKGTVLDAGMLRRFNTLCAVLTVALAVPLGLSVLVTGGIAGTAVVGLWAALALLLWQLQETFRRVLIARMRFAEAIIGDAVRYLGQAALVLGFAMTGTLTLGTAFASIALASVAGVAVQLLQLGWERARWPEIRSFGSEFWRLGRWMLAANLTFLISTLGPQWLLWWQWGQKEMGNFAALSNIVKLSHPLMFGIVGIITPVAARAFSEGGAAAARSVSTRFAVQGFLILLPFYIALLIVPGLAIHLLYGADTPYDGLDNQLRVYVLWYVVLYFASVLGAYLNGLERARHHFHAQLIHAVGAAAVAIPFTLAWGVMGMLVGGVIAKIILAAAFVYYLRHAER